MRSLLSLRKYTRGFGTLVLLALLAMGGAAVLNMLSLAKTLPVFSAVFTTLSTGTDAEKQLAMATLFHKAEMLLAIITAAALTNALALYLGDLIGQRVLVRLRDVVFTHLQTLSMGFFDRQRSGELISRVNNDTVVLQLSLIHI